MKRILVVGTALAALWSSPAVSQPVVVEIEPDRRTVIREYVVKKKVRPATIKGEIRVGASVPADVDLVVVPDDWGPTLTKYRYVYWNDRVVLVNPGDRRVVHIID